MRFFVPALVGLFVLIGCGAAFGAEYRCRDGAEPARIHTGRELRVASLNIAHGRGDSLNQMLIGRARIEQNLDRVAGLIARTGAQVVALQELDVDSLWAGGFDHAGHLLERSLLDCVAVGLHAQTWLYRFGTGLLSSLILDDVQAISFAPTPPTTTKGLLMATLQWHRGSVTRSVRLASVHLDFSRKDVRTRQLSRIVDAINASTVPLILMGDFNEQWQGDDSVIRHLVEETGLQAYEPENMALATYGTKRLDWILVSDELDFSSYRAQEDEISDHRLVIADVHWRGDP